MRVLIPTLSADSGGVAPRISGRNLVVIALLAVTLALALQIRSGFSRASFGDSESYIRTAERLLADGTYPSVTDYFFFRPPAYPCFIAVVTGGNPRFIPALKIANALLHGLTSLFIALLAARVTGLPVGGNIAGLWAALNPLFLYMASDVQSETLFIALSVAAVVLLIRGADLPSRSSAFCGGTLLAIACLTRPSGLFFVPLLGAYLADRRSTPRTRAGLFMASVTGVILILGPWTARNWVRFGAFMPVNNAAGFVIYHGNSQWMVDFFETRTNVEYLAWLHRLNHAIMFEWRAEIEGLDTDHPAEVSRSLAQAGRRWVTANPRVEIGLLMNKTMDWLRPWAYPLVHPRWIVWISGVYYSLLYCLATWGLLMSPRTGLARLALIALMITMAGHVALITQLRYRAAQWDPILIVYASAAAAAFSQHMIRKLAMRRCGKMENGETPAAHKRPDFRNL